MITKKSLRKAFNQSKSLNLNRLECHLLIKSLQGEDGRMDKKLLLAYLKDPLSYEILMDKILEKAPASKKTADDEFQNLIQTLTGYLIEKDISLGKVTEWFRALDNAKDGTMRLYGLQNLLVKLEVNLSRLEVYSIFKSLAQKE